MLAGRIYTGLEKNDKAEAIKKSISKKFPKGITARNEAFGNLFEKNELTAAQAEAEYIRLSKQFQKAVTMKKQGIYGFALGVVAQQFAKEKTLRR
ncbi:hypothetical protein KUH03_26770 [Sphingobacterium sp. E70]|uniref:hypothetical protein n=1 Tax=Sphingobacterium sp. E70 TaxID=2853439 RepID=UPI00211BC89C|nr:hypothetical protein [Sphingobacterium sp. E70]ULT22875.1 hypothetical protein KUH03_26770 [Sphingobacterium sp. E70]